MMVFEVKTTDGRRFYVHADEEALIGSHGYTYQLSAKQPTPRHIRRTLEKSGEPVAEVATVKARAIDAALRQIYGEL